MARPGDAQPPPGSGLGGRSSDMCGRETEGEGSSSSWKGDVPKELENWALLRGLGGSWVSLLLVRRRCETVASAREGWYATFGGGVFDSQLRYAWTAALGY